ncbi:TPA: hypothetical protein I7E69_001918 [Vibrio cholerae]|nr:hypothetical protein [Vibrio cholerae]
MERKIVISWLFALFLIALGWIYSFCSTLYDLRKIENERNDIALELDAQLEIHRDEIKSQEARLEILQLKHDLSATSARLPESR